MPKIKFMPHHIFCPEGVEVVANTGTSILDIALGNNIPMEHACEKSCACSTCHVVVRNGFDSLNETSDDEEDMLDKAWGLEAESRLACQAIVGEHDLAVEIPKYTINQVSENH